MIACPGRAATARLWLCPHGAKKMGEQSIGRLTMKITSCIRHCKVLCKVNTIVLLHNYISIYTTILTVVL